MEDVKKEYLNYLTEIDLINQYSKKRDIPYDEVEDLYNAFRKWVIYKLNDTSLSPKSGFIFPKFVSVLHRHIILDDLKKGEKNPKYQRAEEQLKYYLSGKQKLRVK